MFSRLVIPLFILSLQVAYADIEHTVVSGDTLYDIAQTYGSSVAEIQARNGMTANVIRVGQVLVIPVEVEPPRYRLHLAVAGDTFDTLSRFFDLPPAALHSANPGLSHDGDLAGQLVVVPPGAGVTVWVASGETLIDLAARYGVGPATLATVNGLDAGAELEVGQLLLVPSGDSAGTPPATATAGSTQATAVTTSVSGVPLAVGGTDGRERHRSLQRNLLRRAWEFAGDIERPSAVFLYPLQGRLSSPFGWRNISVGGNRYHGGIDLAAAPGTRIAASRDGIVTKAGWGGAYGYVVFVDHGDGSQTRYGHMLRIDVQQGATVRQGDTLGLVGSSGASTGPHLHFEIRFAGRTVDPLLYLEQSPP